MTDRLSVHELVNAFNAASSVVHVDNPQVQTALAEAIEAAPSRACQ